MKKKKKLLVPILLIIFSLVFLVSAGFVIDYALKTESHKDQYDELAQIVDKIQQQLQQSQPTYPTYPTYPSGYTGPTAPTLPTLPLHTYPSGYTGPTLPTATQPVVIPSAYTEVKHPVTGEIMQVLKEYAPIFELNSDMVGWIKIPGTYVNYPVMQTPDSPNFYLDRDFYKKKSNHGCIYVNEQASLTEPSDNITIYGHKMANGSMFSDLLHYKAKQYYLDHPYIQFDTLTEHHTYQVMAVFTTTTEPGEGFSYHTFVDGNIISFDEFVEKCKDLSIYHTGVDATYGDKLITLSTCDLPIGTKRFVVVAKRIY